MLDFVTLFCVFEHITIHEISSYYSVSLISIHLDSYPQLCLVILVRLRSVSKMKANRVLCDAANQVPQQLFNSTQALESLTFKCPWPQTFVNSYRSGVQSLFLMVDWHLALRSERSNSSNLTGMAQLTPIVLDFLKKLLSSPRAFATAVINLLISL